MSQPEHIRLVGAAEARHRLYQRIENRLEVDRRAADDLEHVGGRGLLLKRLVTFPRSKVDLAVQLRCRLTCGRRLSPFTHTCSASAFGRSPLSFVSLHVAPSPRLADRMLPYRPASGGQLRGAATNRPTSV